MPAVMRARLRRFSAWTAEAKCLMGNKLEIDRAERSLGVFTRAIDENLQLVPDHHLTWKQKVQFILFQFI